MDALAARMENTYITSRSSTDIWAAADGGGSVSQDSRYTQPSLGPGDEDIHWTACGERDDPAHMR